MLHPLAAPDNFLLFSQNRRISRIQIDAPNNDTTPDIVLPIQVGRSVRALAFDPVDRIIYWIDGRNKAIKMVAENDTKVCTGRSRSRGSMSGGKK